MRRHSHTTRPSTPTEVAREERACHRAFRQATDTARQRGKEPDVGAWEFVAGPCTESPAPDGTVRANVRCWLFLRAPGEPVPGWDELHRRHRDGDPNVIEVEGTVEP